MMAHSGMRRADKEVVVGFVALGLYVAHHVAASAGTVTARSDPTVPSYSVDPQTRLNASPSGLVLRELAALPHLVVLGVLGLFDFVLGFVRRQMRVDGYALGLVDR
jgi:hypothetical protein